MLSNDIVPGALGSIKGMGIKGSITTLRAPTAYKGSLYINIFYTLKLWPPRLSPWPRQDLRLRPSPSVSVFWPSVIRASTRKIFKYLDFFQASYLGWSNPLFVFLYASEPSALSVFVFASKPSALSLFAFNFYSSQTDSQKRPPKFPKYQKHILGGLKSKSFIKQTPQKGEFWFKIQFWNYQKPKIKLKKPP